jgi:hypothetical protein
MHACLPAGRNPLDQGSRPKLLLEVPFAAGTRSIANALKTWKSFFGWKPSAVRGY